MDEWKDIKGFEGIYQVSNLGRIRSLDREVKKCNGEVFNLKGKVLSFWADSQSYFSCSLRKDGKYHVITIHRLVATHFVDNPESRPNVCHLNGDKTDNRAENLKWVRSNTIDSSRVKSITNHYKLTESNAKFIRENYNRKKGITMKCLATHFNVTISCINAVLKRNTWN